MTTTSATTSTGPKGFRWLYLILGIVLFVFGVGIIRHPVASYFGLAMYFSIVIIVIGISEIMNAFAGGNSRHWGWGLFIGLLDLIIGFILLTTRSSRKTYFLTSSALSSCSKALITLPNHYRCHR